MRLPVWAMAYPRRALGHQVQVKLPSSPPRYARYPRWLSLVVRPTLAVGANTVRNRLGLSRQVKVSDQQPLSRPRVGSPPARRIWRANVVTALKFVNGLNAALPRARRRRSSRRCSPTQPHILAAPRLLRASAREAACLDSDISTR